MVTENNLSSSSDVRSGCAFVCRPFAVCERLEQRLLLTVQEVDFGK